MENFNENKPYEVTYRGKHIELFTEGIRAYIDFLNKWAGEGNESIKEKLAEAAWLNDSLQQQGARIQSEYGLGSVHLNGKYWSLIKSTLPYLISVNEAKIKEIQSEGAPKEATEGLATKVELLRELNEKGFMSEIPELEIRWPSIGTEGKSSLSSDGSYIPEGNIKEIEDFGLKLQC